MVSHVHMFCCCTSCVDFHHYLRNYLLHALLSVMQLHVALKFTFTFRCGFVSKFIILIRKYFNIEKIICQHAWLHASKQLVAFESQYLLGN